MSATPAIRRQVADYAKWRAVYDGAESPRARHGCTAVRVPRLPGDASDVLVTHDFPAVGRASGFAGDPPTGATGLAMRRAGVDAISRMEVFASV